MSTKIEKCKIDEDDCADSGFCGWGPIIDQQICSLSQFIALALNVEYVVKSIKHIFEKCLRKIGHCRKTKPGREKQTTDLKLVIQK